MTCIPTERLWAVAWTLAMEDDLLLTPEEFDHLEACNDCFQRWADCLRRLPEQDFEISA
jgi:hypothetical protein